MNDLPKRLAFSARLQSDQFPAKNFVLRQNRFLAARKHEKNHHLRSI